VCSAVDEQSSEDARSRLVRGAVALVGEIGPTATTVRAVAERAGVSPPLVMHHFGSKDGLLAACDDHVRGVLEAAAAALVTGGASESTMSALLALPDVSAALSYVARSLLHDGEVGRWWFDEMLRLTLDGLADAEAVGLARPAADPLARAILLISMDLGMVLLRPLVEARLGGSLADAAIVERWTRAEMDLLSHGVLTPRPAPADAVRAADGRSAHEADRSAHQEDVP
jgi:TetR/AcrR family transcriptional regulator, regulator of cefoperazone and chloramphenicol sensitivity